MMRPLRPVLAKANHKTPASAAQNIVYLCLAPVLDLICAMSQLSKLISQQGIVNPLYSIAYILLGDFVTCIRI